MHHLRANAWRLREKNNETDCGWTIERGEIVMRNLVLPILAVGAVYAAAPSQAQTYDPNYPICLQIYDDMVHYYFDCSYTSMAQCQASASGRAAQCVVNPFPAKAYKRPGPRHKRSRRH
jgi:hypothetical protein